MSSDFDVAGDTVLHPSKLAHVVLRTNNFKPMIQFYKTFLGAQSVHENDFISFLSYDDEHHRIAIIGMPSIKPKDKDSCGLEHIAFTFDTLKDLLIAYRQRKAKDILPIWCVNHGPTTSIYYRDADGNMIETQVDNFDDPDEATKFMGSSLFRENPIGTDFHPEELIGRLVRGESEEQLKKRVEIGARGRLPEFFYSS